MLYPQAVTGHYLTLTVQEYCDATTLTNAIARGVFRANPQWGVRLARRALLRTASEMARALLHLHDAGVIHGTAGGVYIAMGASSKLLVRPYR